MKISILKLFVLAALAAVIADEVHGAERMAVVDLSEQTLTVFEGDRELLQVQASTGRATHKTPEGVFKATNVRRKLWVSSRYPKRKDGTQGGAKMPWALQIHGNIFIHAGDVSKPNQSHGCVRVDPDYAEAVYKLLPAGTTVVVMP